jgi:MFS family permease
VPAPSSTSRRNAGFLAAIALAHAGGVFGYLPLLTLLLPLKVQGMAGEARLGVFTATVIAGAIAASASNVLFGWLSDRAVTRGGGRRRGLAAGAVATVIAFAGVAGSSAPAQIVAAIIAFQIAVNALLAPLFAIMADEVPDAQKGVLGGLLALANPLASALSSLVLWIALGEGARLALVALALALAILPLLVSAARPIAAAAPGAAAPPRRDFLVAWGARLLVQVAGNVLSLYLLYFFESVVPGFAPDKLAPRIGHLLTIAYALPLPVALLVGRLSDRSGRRKPFLLGAAMVATVGLLMMASAPDWIAAAAGFILYTIGSAVYLALHSGFAMQLLPDPAHRGRDLGLLNLANTLPALAGPALTWWLATPRDFGAVMLALAALTACGGVAILGVRGRR